MHIITHFQYCNRSGPAPTAENGGASLINRAAPLDRSSHKTSKTVTIEDDAVSDDEGTKTLKAMGKAANLFYDNLRDSGQQQTQVISDPAAMLQARINLAEKTAAVPAGTSSAKLLNRLLERELKQMDEEDASKKEREPQ